MKKKAYEVEDCKETASSFLSGANVEIRSSSI